MAVTINGSTGVQLDDNDKQEFGTGDDLEIFHDGSDSWVKNGTGAMLIAADSILLKDNANSENLARFAKDGAVKLYHDGTLQCETSANGLAFPSGKGIDFSAQTATSAAGTGNLAELLDHYEEGSCTMNYSPASGAFGGMVYTSGKYTRIGRLVTVTGAISLHSNTNASGNVYITGWPFTVTGLNSTWSLEGGHGTIRGEYNYPDEFNMIVMNNGGTNAYVYNDSGTELNVSNMNTGYNESQCSFTVTYMTDD